MSAISAALCAVAVAGGMLGLGRGMLALRGVASQSHGMLPLVFVRPPASGTERRLRCAMVDATPTGWRMLQVEASLVALVALTALGVGIGTAAVCGSCIARIGLGAWLRLRACRLHLVCGRAAPAVARAIATELSTGVGLAGAFGVSGRAVTGGAAIAVVSALFNAVDARIRAGQRPDEALNAALTIAAATDPRVTATLLPVARAMSLASGGGAVAADALRRLGEGIEAETRSRDQARAAATEARFVAAALPTLTLVMVVVVCSLSPRALAIALSGPGFIAICVALGMACLGVATVMAGTRPW